MSSRYYCHNCQRPVGLRDTDLSCGICGSDFIEQVDDVPRAPHPGAQNREVPVDQPIQFFPFHGLQPGPGLVMRGVGPQAGIGIPNGLFPFLQARNAPSTAAGRVSSRSLRPPVSRSSIRLGGLGQAIPIARRRARWHPVGVAHVILPRPQQAQATNENQQRQGEGNVQGNGQANPNVQINPNLNNIMQVMDEIVRPLLRVAVAGGQAQNQQEANPNAGNGAQQGRSRSNSEPNLAAAAEGEDQHNDHERPATGANMLQDLLRSITNMGEGTISFSPNVHFRVQIGDSDQLHGNVGDYVFGNNMDQIIEQLMNQTGQPVARGVSEDQLNNLPMTKITQTQVDNQTQCPTCFDNFELDEQVAEVACHHVFHRDCLVPWLRQQRTCPMCRKEINPDDWPTATNPPTSSKQEIVDIDELD